MGAATHMRLQILPNAYMGMNVPSRVRTLLAFIRHERQVERTPGNAFLSERSFEWMPRIFAKMNWTY